MALLTTPRAFLSALAMLVALMVLTLPPAALAQSPGTTGEQQPPAATGQPSPQQTQRNDYDPRLETPSGTVLTFIEAMYEWRTFGADTLDDAMACCNFGSIPDGEPRRSAVGKLYNIFNKIGLVTQDEFDDPLFARYPDEPGATWMFFPRDDQPAEREPLARKHGSVVRIQLERDNAGAWRFSAQTMGNLDAMQLKLRDEEILVGQGEVAVTLADRVRLAMPQSLRSGTFLTLEYWVWVVIFCVILAGVLVDFIVRSVLISFWHRFERRRGARDDAQSDRDVLKRAVRPFGLFAGALVWYSAIHLADLSPTAYMVLSTAIHVVLSIAGVWAAWRVVDLLKDFALKQTAKTETKFDDLLVPLVERTAKIFVFALGLVYIANAFDIPIIPLLSGLGIGGLAVAFAAKDTIENFFGSVAVILDRPFEVGDWIVVNDTEGTVEELGFRSTRIRTFYNSLVTVPNATLVRATVDNYGRRRYRRFKTMVNLTYDTPPDKIEAFCEGIREIIRQHPYTRKDYYHVWLNAFGAHSLDVLVYMFHECPDWSIELRERHRFMLDVIRLADRLGVEFAFPTQTLHVFQEEQGKGRDPMPTPARSAETDAQRSGIEAARALTESQPWREQRPGPVTFAIPRRGTHEARGDSGE